MFFLSAEETFNVKFFPLTLAVFALAFPTVTLTFAFATETVPLTTFVPALAVTFFTDIDFFFVVVFVLSLLFSNGSSQGVVISALGYLAMVHFSPETER